MTNIIAIDPGASGGIAVHHMGKTFAHNMPDTQGDIHEAIADIVRQSAIEGQEIVCYLEEVSGFAGKQQPGSAMFRFGDGYGFIKGVVMTLRVRLLMVRPQQWQKALGLGTAASCASRTVWKNKLKAEAQRRFPQLKVTLRTADALLILEYALSHQGTTEPPKV
jgi:hypothetical protein